MESKRRNMFYKNKKQETTKICHPFVIVAVDAWGIFDAGVSLLVDYLRGLKRTLSSARVLRRPVGVHVRSVSPGELKKERNQRWQKKVHPTPLRGATEIDPPRLSGGGPERGVKTRTQRAMGRPRDDTMTILMWKRYLLWYVVSCSESVGNPKLRRLGSSRRDSPGVVTRTRHGSTFSRYPGPATIPGL
ncbi:hypothetical protein AAG570_003171 [Ranatra chinensis]|uniref:Uncharacterized protein n=1 Tax=Ranatra chinensis TaxID=642074 RepID=A0ABD0Y637_9HEMI